MTATTYTTKEGAIQTRNLFTWDAQALATGGVIRAAPGVLVEVFGTNNSASIRYVQLFDATAVPADTAVPKVAPIAVPPGSSFSLKLDDGIEFGTGISWASSSTLATKTITGVADVWLTAFIQ